MIWQPSWVAFQRGDISPLHEFPNDAIVYHFENKSKADKIILTNRRLIRDLDIWNEENICLEIIQYNPWFIKCNLYGNYLSYLTRLLIDNIK